MSDAQPHDYSTAPFGVHGLPQELQPHADLHARLTRAEVGASDTEAAALIAALPPETIKSESDALLAARVADYRREGEVFKASERSIEEVLGHVGDDVNRAQEALASEKDRDKPRKTLIAKLEAILDDQQANTPPVVANSGPAEGAGTVEGGTTGGTVGTVGNVTAPAAPASGGVAI